MAIGKEREGEGAAKASEPPAPATATATATATEKTPQAAVEELPRAIVRRLVKDKLTQLSAAGGKEGGEDVNVQKDALLAFGESARIFIHYLSATANDICSESKRQTINAEDVLKAIEDIDFPEFAEPLRASLDEFRRKNARKKSAVRGKEAGKKRKVEEEPPEQDEEHGTDGAEEDKDGAEDEDHGADVAEEDKDGAENDTE